MASRDDDQKPKSGEPPAKEHGFGGASPSSPHTGAGGMVTISIAPPSPSPAPASSPTAVTGEDAAAKRHAKYVLDVLKLTVAYYEGVEAAF